MAEGAAGFAEVLRTRDFVGWEVVDRSGEKVGSIADVLIDRAGKVRFLDMEYGLPKKHVLLPAQHLEWGDRRFVVGGWSKDEIRSLPPYGSELLDGPRLADLERSYPWMYGSETQEWRVPAGEIRIVPLSEAKDFKLQSGAPDLRGWNVFGADGERVGVVTEMLVDPTALRIRYIDVDLHDDLFPLPDDRHVLVPLEYVDLKERGNDVWLQRLSAADVARRPAYPGGPVRPAMERVVAAAFGERGPDSVGPGPGNATWGIGPGDPGPGTRVE
jgi:sporulation protein YlmC with PRC-barrel domain